MHINFLLYFSGINRAFIQKSQYILFPESTVGKKMILLQKTWQNKFLLIFKNSNDLACDTSYPIKLKDLFLHETLI